MGSFNSPFSFTLKDCHMVVESILIKLAEKVVDGIIEQLAGKPVSALLEDAEKKSAFKKVISESFQALVDKEFEVGTKGTLYKEFFLDEDVFKELWLKVVDPASAEEIDFDLLEEKFKNCWQVHVDIDKKARDGIEYFCDQLDDALYCHPELYQLLNTKRLREARVWISLDEIENLKEKCLEHIKTTKQEEFQKELGKENIYVEPALERRRERPQPKRMHPSPEDKKIEKGTYFDPISIAEIVRRDKNDLILVSESGMGKTTFLKWLELSISKGQLSKHYLPVYIHLSILRDYTTQDQLVSYLATQFSKVAEDRKLKLFVKAILKSCEFFFLLDGLDQVSDLSIIPEQLEKKKIYGDSKIIVATRQTGYSLSSNRLRNYKFIQLVPFDQKRVEKYLKERIENPKVKEIIRQNRELVRIPALLQMISSLLGEDERKLSEIKTRSHLYAKFIDQLFERERELEPIRGKSDPCFKEEMKSDLPRLSYELIDQGYLGSFPASVGFEIIKEKNRLKDLLRWGILNRVIEQKEDKIEFRHQSFQEYFASRELKNKIFKDEKLHEQEFRNHSKYKKWHLSLLFLIGMLEENWAEKLIRKIKEYDLFFAGLCVSHYPGDKGEFKDIIEELFSLSEKGSLEESFSVLSRMDERMIIDRFLGLLTGYETKRVREAAIKALGEIGNPKAVDSLMKALHDKDVRWAAVEALVKIADPKAIDALIKRLKDKQEDKYVREAAAKALGETGNPKAVGILVEALKDKYVGWVAAEALGKIGGSEAIGHLIKALKEENEDVRMSVAEVLGKIGASKAVDHLMRALNDESEYVRLSAAGALGKIGDPRAVDILVEALKDKSLAVRSAVAKALGEIGDPKAVDTLIRTLRDRNLVVRWAVVEALGEIRDSKAIDPLIKALKDEDENLRMEAAIALGEIGDVKAVESLIKTFKDDSKYVRQAAAEALSKIRDPKAFHGLVNALKKEE